MHSDISQSSTCSSSRLTSSALFEVKLQFVKVPLLHYLKCRLLHPANKSTEPPNHIHIHTHTHTHKQSVQCMHAFIHSFIQSTIFTLSLFHKNEPSITTAIHHNHNHPSIINHALHGPLSMAFVHARMTLP